MADSQRRFLELFRAEFGQRFGARTSWHTGQVAANTAGLTPQTALRRGGLSRAGEVFEIGDLRCDLPSQTVIVEYESDAIAIHNLLKYWPYLRGELNVQPAQPLMLCHFSNWASYGSHRDLWEWLCSRMTDDMALTVPFQAKQFDHWKDDIDRRRASISAALDWIGSATFHAERAADR